MFFSLSYVMFSILCYLMFSMSSLYCYFLVIMFSILRYNVMFSMSMLCYVLGLMFCSGSDVLHLMLSYVLHVHLMLCCSSFVLVLIVLHLMLCPRCSTVPPHVHHVPLIYGYLPVTHTHVYCTIQQHHTLSLNLTFSILYTCHRDQVIYLM